jgi:hypothetical protein
MTTAPSRDGDLPSRLGACGPIGPYRWDRARASWSSNAVPEAVGSGWMRMVVMGGLPGIGRNSVDVGQALAAAAAA